MGRSRIFHAHRQPLGEASNNPFNGDNTKTTRGTWYSSNVTSLKTPASVSVSSTSTGSRSESRDDSLRGWLASKTRTLRSHSTAMSPSIVSSVSSASSLTEPCHIIQAPKRAISDVGVNYTNQTVLLRTNIQGSPTNSIVAQVCGGALERVFWLNNTLVLQFLYGHSADRFYKYAQKGRFIVNGRIVIPEPAAVSGSLMLDRDPEFDQYIIKGARRTLKIFRYVHSAKHHVIYSQVDMCELKKAFGSVGNVMSIQPMFARHQVAFLIQYDEISKAFKAKSMFECQNILFARFQQWKVEYVSDITERPCIF